jgi:hypothetical protein
MLVAFSPDRPLDKHTIAALQAAVIGQTFALLSGRAEHLMSVQASHGTFFVATRECFNSIVRSRRPHDSCFQAKDWSEWVTTQTVTRLLNPVHVHNGEIAAITQQPAFTRTQPLTIPVAAPDNRFLAKNANEWANLQHTQSAHSLPSRSTFSSCAMLECFIGEISHARCSSFHLLSDQDIDEYQTALCTWFFLGGRLFQSRQIAAPHRAQPVALLLPPPAVRHQPRRKRLCQRWVFPPSHGTPTVA